MLHLDQSKPIHPIVITTKLTFPNGLTTKPLGFPVGASKRRCFDIFSCIGGFVGVGAPAESYLGPSCKKLPTVDFKNHFSPTPAFLRGGWNISFSNFSHFPTLKTKSHHRKWQFLKKLTSLHGTISAGKSISEGNIESASSCYLWLERPRTIGRIR